jgi:integrase/recombinase XerD
MSADSISPLRQRMIEAMSARKLNPHTQRSHISNWKRFAAYLKRSPDTAADEIRLFQLHLTETGASICNRNRITVLVSRDAAAIGSCGRDLSHQRIPEDPVGDEPGRGQAPVGHDGKSQGSLIARSRLRRRFAREVVRLRVRDIDSAQNII